MLDWWWRGRLLFAGQRRSSRTLSTDMRLLKDDPRNVQSKMEGHRMVYGEHSTVAKTALKRLEVSFTNLNELPMNKLPMKL